VTKFRNWLHKQADGGPQWGKAAVLKGVPQRLKNEVLFDTFNSHTKHCTVCQKALKNLNRIKTTSLIIAAISGLLLRGWKGFLSASVFCGFSYLIHKYTSLFYKYEFSHQNNN
jgi:hypothetical protein